MAKKKQNIEEYATRQGASQQHIDIEMEIVTKLLGCINTLENARLASLEDAAGQYKRGWVAGLDRGRSEGTEKPYMDKESRRSESIARCFNTQPQLR